MTYETLPRFVILHHRPGSNLARESGPSPAGEHFDWMFQLDGKLKTWATEIVADLTVPVQIPARQLADHRLHYLDFEGDIGGDRGTVQQVIRGTFQIVERTTKTLTATLDWTQRDQQTYTRRVEIYRNLTSESGSDDARAAWGLRLRLD